MMRKMFLILSALFLVFALAACGDSDGGGSGVSSGGVSSVEVRGSVADTGTGSGTVDIINPATGEKLNTDPITIEGGKFTGSFEKPKGNEFALLFVANIQGQEEPLRNLSFFDLTLTEPLPLTKGTAVVWITINEASTELANSVLGEGNNLPENFNPYESGVDVFSFAIGNIVFEGQIGGEPGAEEPVETVGDSEPVKFAVYEDGHQKVYNSTEDTSFEAKITDIYSSPADNKTTVTISVTKDGKPYAGSFPGWEFSFYWTVYDNGKYSGYITPARGTVITPVSNNDGTFDITFSPAVEMKPNMIFYLGGVRAERKVGPRDYFGEKDYVNAVYVEGDVPAVQADPAGCDNCHMKNLLKHGYISTRPIDQDGTVRPFFNCVVCHNNGRESHGEPVVALNLNDTTPASTDATLRNTVHAFHEEFDYPQSMSNCVTCHTGTQLDYVLANAFKDYDTCQTCHGDLIKDSGMDFALPHDEGYKTRNCYFCHEEADIGPKYAEIHNGGYEFSKYYYNPTTKTAVKWSDKVKYQIDEIKYDNVTNELTVNWRVLVDGKLYDLKNSESAELDFDTGNVTNRTGPYILVGYLGFGSQDVVAYTQAGIEFNDNGTATSRLTLNTDTLRDYGVEAVKVGILGAPLYKESADDEDGIRIAVTSITKNFNLETKKEEAIGLTVSQEKCDSCHNELIMHEANRYSAGNPDSCMFCHNPATRGRNYAGQSRALDTYLHALHEGQPRNNGIVMDEYPAGSMANCAKCHIDGFTIPNQIDDLGAYLSAEPGGSDGFITGPAAAACGSCHKAYMISHGYDTTSINSHFRVLGYYVPASEKTYIEVMKEVKEGKVGESCSTCHRP